MTTELAGFKTVARDATVTTNAVAKLDFKLEVGAQSETVTVEGVSPVIEFSDKLNNRVDSARIEAMPLSGRDFNSLLNVMPGIQHRAGGGFQGVNIGGARTSSNNFMIDGISNNEVYYGDTVLNQTGDRRHPGDAGADRRDRRVHRPADAVGRVRRQRRRRHQHRHEERRQRAARHRLLLPARRLDRFAELLRPSPRKARQGRRPTRFEEPAVRRHVRRADRQKDKTFFFGYYEGQRLAVTSPYDVAVPTDAQVAAARARIAAAGLKTNSIGEALLKFYPTDPSGNQHVNGTTVANMNTFSIKIDQQLNAKNLINGRVFYGRSFQSAPAGNSGEIVSPNQPVDLFNSVTDPTTASLAGLVWNSTLSDHAVLEARVGYNRFWNPIVVNNSIDPASLGINTGPLDVANFGVPAVTTPFGNIGGAAGYPIFVTPSTDWSLAGSLTQTLGSHTVKIGGSWDRMYNQSIRDQARTSLTANGRTSDPVDALVGILLARFEQASRSFGSTVRNMTQKSGGAYINDDWKVSARLTLSAGLRYDLSMPITEQNNLATNFLPSQGLVQLGTSGLDAALQSRQEQLRAARRLRVGSGGRREDERARRVRADLRHRADGHAASRPVQHAGLGRLQRRVQSDAAVRARCARRDLPRSEQLGGRRRLRLPAARRADLRLVADRRAAVQHHGGQRRFPCRVLSLLPHDVPARDRTQQLGDRLLCRIARDGPRVWRRNINAPPLGSPTSGAVDRLRPFFAQYPQYPQHRLEFNNDGKSWFDSLQLSFRQNQWHGINTQYNYTLSKCTDYQSTNRAPTTLQATNPYDPSNDKGPCTFDIRHNFNFGGSYAVPGTSVGGAPLQIGAVLTVLSGRPFTPGLGTFDQTGQAINAIRADCLADPTYNYSLDYLFPDANTSRSAITNAAQAFATPAAGKLGSCGRDSGARTGVSPARPQFREGVQAAGRHAAAGALGDLQPDQPRQSGRLPEHQHSQRLVRQDRVDAGRGPRQSGAGHRAVRARCSGRSKCLF